MRLPLFPLGSVLYPGLLMPLFVFEERYQRLVADLNDLPEDQRRFGVVAIRQGREVGADGVSAVHEVGCVAVVRQAKRLDGGRWDLQTTGAQRFRLESVDTATAPYWTGRVELLDEPPGDEPTLLAEAVRALFGRYRAALVDDDDEEQSAPEDPRVLSYLVAAAMLLDLPDKQRLLAAPDTSARLRAEAGILRREVALLKAVRAVPSPDLLRQPLSAN